MAQRIMTVMTDDIDGTELAEGDGGTVSFSFDGTSYEIDLSNENIEAFREAIGEYIEAARKVGRSTGGVRSKRGSSGPTPQEIREWARSNGYEVPERGRIPANIREAYDAR